jgi:hypothetical protein
MGFTAGQIDRAYGATKGNVAAGIEWCLSHPDDTAGQTLGGSAGGQPLGGAAAPPPARAPAAAADTGAATPMDTAGGPDNKTAARTQEEQDVLDDIYGEDGPPAGGVSGVGAPGSKFPGIPNITADMTPEQQLQMCVCLPPRARVAEWGRVCSLEMRRQYMRRQRETVSVVASVRPVSAARAGVLTRHGRRPNRRPSASDRPRRPRRPGSAPRSTSAARAWCPMGGSAGGGDGLTA